MHFRLNFITEAKNAEDAIIEAENYMQDSDGCDWFDWYEIGGRWDGDGIEGNAGLITVDYYNNYLKEYDGVEIIGGDYAPGIGKSPKEMRWFNRHVVNTTGEPISNLMVNRYYCVIIDYHN